MGKHPQPEKPQINSKSQDQDAEQRQNNSEENPPDSISQCERPFQHEARLYG